MKGQGGNASGQEYGGRHDRGNTQPGDGRRYKGRGPIQVTARGNYRRYGRMLGIDVEQRPELVSAPSIGLMVSCAPWQDRELNAFADRDNRQGTTRTINGGTRDLANRAERLATMETLLQ